MPGWAATHISLTGAQPPVRAVSSVTTCSSNPPPRSWLKGLRRSSSRVLKKGLFLAEARTEWRGGRS